MALLKVMWSSDGTWLVEDLDTLLPFVHVEGPLTITCPCVLICTPKYGFLSVRGVLDGHTIRGEEAV